MPEINYELESVKAAARGQLRLVRFCVEVHKTRIDYDVNQSYYKERTSLHAAAERGHLDIVKYLLSKNANVSGIDLTNHSAGYLFSLFTWSYSSNRGVDYSKFATPLLRAVKAGHVEIARVLIENGASLEPRVPFLGNLLHLAVLSDNPEMIALMLDQKFDINETNERDSTPFVISMNYRKTASLKFLLEKGVKYWPEMKSLHLLDYIWDQELLPGLRTLLEFIKRKEGIGKVVDYLETNSDVAGTRKNETLLLIAAACNDPELIILLLSKDGVHINDPDPRSLSAVRFALFHNATESFKILLENGADYWRMDCKIGFLEIYLDLLDAEEKGGAECLKTLLGFIEAKEGRSKVVKHVNDDQNFRCRSVLHLACMRGRTSQVELLLEFGANPNMKDIYGLKPRDLIPVDLEADRKEMLGAMLRAASDQ